MQEKKEVTSVRLTEEQRRKLDALVQELGCSRGIVVGQLLESARIVEVVRRQAVSTISNNANSATQHDRYHER